MKETHVHAWFRTGAVPIQLWGHQRARLVCVVCGKEDFRTEKVEHEEAD